jgi:hypothetical protein
MMSHQTEKRVSVFDNPAYPVSEAARILNLPAATVKAWCFGQAYRAASGKTMRFKSVIQPADANARQLSFAKEALIYSSSPRRRRSSALI